jgi:hypothetical protein
MAQLSGVLHTAMETVRREQILDEIFDVSPDSNYLTSTLGRVELSQVLYQWPEYYVSRNTSVDKAQQGDDNTYSDLTVATMRNNHTQIIKKPFAVSETEIVVNKVSPKDAYAREMNLAMRSLKNSMEWSVLNGTKVSVASGVAGETEGFINQTRYNSGAMFTKASGTSLAEAIFNDGIIYNSWNVTDEYVVDLILATGTQKSQISKFTAGNTRNVSADDKRLVRTISIYESDYGIHEIRTHKDLASFSTNAVVGLRKELCKIGYLRQPKHVPNSVTGDNRKGHIVTELGVVAQSSKPHVVWYS